MEMKQIWRWPCTARIENGGDIVGRRGHGLGNDAKKMVFVVPFAKQLNNTFLQCEFGIVESFEFIWIVVHPSLELINAGENLLLNGSLRLSAFI